ncbi:MAG: LacI family DNA-binding transcriptional regulator [Bacteroidia bacterium]|nr:LacI family DNA-binding transcriptional regulator [Bacteroidia bacterium]
MKKNIRIMDIAEKAGVSIGTVDRVLHDRGEVSVETRDKILKIIRDFDYRPNILASSLASKKVTTFASLIPWAADKDAFWSKPQEGIDKAINQLQQYGIRLQQFYFNMEDPETFTIEAEKILELSPDGILLAPWAKRESLKFTQELDRKAIPYVFIDSNMKEANPISFIVQNSVQSGYLAAKLIDYGIVPQSNILIIHITKDLQNANHLLLREKGFFDYFETVKNKCHRIVKIEVPPNEIEIVKKLKACILEEKSIDAVFVTNSKVNLVAGFFDQLNNRPKIIGYDLIPKNIDLLLNSKIDFLLNQNPESQGYVATNLLFDQIVRKEKVKKENYTSIDIITKENIEYYSSV